MNVMYDVMLLCYLGVQLYVQDFLLSTFYCTFFYKITCMICGILYDLCHINYCPQRYTFTHSNHCKVPFYLQDKTNSGLLLFSYLPSPVFLLLFFFAFFCFLVRVNYQHFGYIFVFNATYFFLCTVIQFYITIK